MALVNLLHIESNQKWILNNTSIDKVEKTKGSLKNLIDFNRIVQFTCQEIHKCPSSEATLYVDNLTRKYHHIKESIEKQSPITRLFLTVVLFFCRFHKNFDALLTTYHSLKPKHIQTPNEPLTANPVLKGGFTNAGNTCFIAAPLHCLNVMKELLPKSANDLEKSKEETDEQFSKRQFVAEKILKLLEASDQRKTTSGEKLNELRPILNDFGGGIPEGKAPGHTIDVMKVLLKIFNFPHLQEIITLKSGKTITEKAQAIATSVVVFTENEIPTGKGALRYFTPQADGSYQPSNKEVTDLKTGEAPLFIPVYVIRNHGPQVPIPNILTFSNLQDTKYDLIACQSGSTNHAYSYVKSNDKWIKYDDASVGFVSDETAHIEMGKGCDMFIFKRLISS